MFSQQLRADKKDEALENALPPISDYCKIIKANQEDEFIVKQLLLQARLFDFADEVGRRNLSSLIGTRPYRCGILIEQVNMLLKPFSPELLKVMMKMLATLHPDDSDFIRTVSEVIAEIQDPIDTETGWEKNSPEAWLHILSIIEALLENTNTVRK
jgi:hypothetical protein